MKINEEERMKCMEAFEESIYSRGISVFAGVDEAGRGPLAGDVYAAAVILRPGTKIPGLNDSKKLSEKKREALFDVIKEQALSWSVGTASVAEIEETDILSANFLAMRRAVSGLSENPELILVDGNLKIRGLEEKCEAVVKGDSSSLSIAAASVLAKVSRDRYMKEMAKKYPEYEFEKHKGYGTARHIELIKMYGPSEIHRRSFLKNILP